MYFDAVVDANMVPVFNGTREQTLVWLKENPEYLKKNDHRVVIGETLQVVTPWEFVNMYN